MDDWLFLLETIRKSWMDAGKPNRVTVAVSGGADSAALLRALKELSSQTGFSLFAAHVDHGLRSVSAQDAAFAADECAKLGVPCRVIRVQVNGTGEDAARDARYRALFDACMENASPTLALAHHARDQAETVLLHLFRGSGSGGLSAMTAYGPRHWPGKGELFLWRPLLTVSPDLIRRALTRSGVSWREDETNFQDQYLRNYIRHQVLPTVEKRVPGAEKALCRAARVLGDEHDYFTLQARAFLAGKGRASLREPCYWVRLDELAAQHIALRRHALRMACPVPLDWETTEALIGLRPGQKMNLPKDWRAYCSRAFLHFLPPLGTEPDPPVLSPDMLLSSPWNGEKGDGKRVQALPRRILEGSTLRFGEPGDMIHPLGSPGHKSMQDYWVDKKVDQPFRRFMPLLCKEHQVLWAIGAGPGEEARVNPGDDAVLLRYTGPLPMEADARPFHTP